MIPCREWRPAYEQYFKKSETVYSIAKTTEMSPPEEMKHNDV